MRKIAIIGTGNIAKSHARAYLEFPERCRVVALCDIVEQKAHVFKEIWGLDDADVVEYEELLRRAANGEVDLVSNCTPPSEHARLTIDLLNAGANVIVEKPMAPSLQECDAMIAAAEASGKLLSVIAQNRFRDDLHTVKAIIDSGLIGPVSHIRVDSAWWRDLAYYDKYWRGTWESEGGGPTLNHAIHHFDLVLWMLNSPDSVTASMVNSWHKNSEVEDLAVSLLTYPEAIVTVTSSVNHHGEPQAIVVQGRDASIGQPWQIQASVGQSSGFPYPMPNAELIGRIEEFRASLKPLKYTGHTGQIEDVLTALDDGRQPFISGEDGRRTEELVTATYAAAIERRTIDLPITDESPWYSGEKLLERAPRFGTKRASTDESTNGTYNYGGAH